MPISGLQPPVKLTKTVIDRTPLPQDKPCFLRDTELKGFGLRITPQGVRAFILEKRIHGRLRRMTLGRYGELTCEQARRQARIFLGKIALGDDPVAERHKARVKATTLAQAFDEFLKARKTLKPKTRYDYQRVMKTVFKDWQAKSITAITKRMVQERHRQLGETRGEYHANGSFRVLRTVLNFAQAQYDDGNGHSLLLENPVRVLTQTRAWYHQERRRTIVKAHDLPAWYRAVQSLKAADEPDTSHAIADWLVLTLFTGLRRNEGLQLRWSHIDFNERTLLIPDPKNREPLTLPLSDFLMTLLQARSHLAVSDYVFPGKDGKGYIQEPKRQIAHVIARSGIHFIPHDLRRTFITVAESLDIPLYAIKRLVNHKMNGDVTAGYIVSDVERLRWPMQQVTNYLVSVLGLDPRPRVVYQERRPWA